MFSVFKSIVAKFRGEAPLPDYVPDPYWDWEELVTPHFGYNRWLEDYLMQGGRITHFEPYRYPGNARVVSAPHTYEQIPHKEDIPTMQGPAPFPPHDTHTLHTCWKSSRRIAVRFLK